MTENRCYACYAKIEEGKADCSVCGMPNLKVVGDNEKAVAMIQKLGEEHRQEKLKGISISLIAYEHERVDGKLREKATHKVKIADASNLTYQKTFWFGEKFARVDTQRTMDLDLVIDGPTSKKVNFKFKAPKLEDFWRIGICMKEGFCASVKIGNEQAFVETDTFSMI